MSEIQTTQTNKQKGVRKCKKLSTRVDLTPMVDLGFLLITFFIFTTSLTEPKITKLVMPSNEIDENPTKIPKSKVLQVLLKNNNKLVYYFGDAFEAASTTYFTANGIRQIILEKQKQVATKYGNKEEMILLIKPMDDCNYKNVIDILDEVQINNIKRYVFVDPSKEDYQLVNSL